MSRQLGWMFVCLTAGCFFAGCDGSGGKYKSAQQLKQEKQASGKTVTDDHDHGHGAAGPHGGAIVELGDEEYHAEVVVDGKTHTLRVYLLGGDAKTAAPVAATAATVMTEDEKSLSLKAAPQEGEADGKASVFELVDEAAVGALLKAGYLHGSLQLEVSGKPYRGDIDAHFDGSSHDDHAAPHAEESKDKTTDAPSEKPTEGDAATEASTTDKPAEAQDK